MPQEYYTDGSPPRTVVDDLPDCEWCGAPASNGDDLNRIAKLEAALDKVEMMISEGDHPNAVVRHVREVLGKPVN